jgi:tellurite resistance protein
MSVREIAEQALKFLHLQPWAPERRILSEMSCAGVTGGSEYGASRSEYIHTSGGGDTLTLRISDHKHGEHQYEILTGHSRDQIQFTLHAYAAACACLASYDEESELRQREADWRAEADNALREYDRAAIAEKLLDILSNHECESDPSPLPSVEEIMGFVDDEDAQVYGAFQHLAGMNRYLHTHLHRLDANDPQTFELRDQRDWTIQYYEGLFLAEQWSETVSEFECDGFLGEIVQLYCECRARG